ncbi:M48 family metallopeptidase [Exilibacterium tricleocarpae]|uniref:M48 family metallopeptidase n=1 Tax=Exilibacterium tricleocarpae TaxID=2591008 RepID=A0A545TS91_9GAMM|nr:M48 family metallopeptidase [Exilibacterium tricleocarpae]TQV80083.1 M48 family metallopeptidase [Exilibacterium tricleocarpae]
MIQGWFFDGKTSRRRAAELSCGGSGRWVLRVDGDTILSVAFDEATVSPRVGATARMITFPDGQIFESPENDAIDAVLRRHRPGFHLMAFAETIENHKGFIAATVVVVVAGIWSLLRYGVPAVSEATAHALPVAVTHSVSSQTLTFLDASFFSPSELPEQRQEELRAQFKRLLPRDTEGFDYRILFRQGGDGIGANAFALPDATVVFTDEIVALAEDDAELQGIMLHEIGHVVHRHGLQQVIRQSLLSSLIVWITGDISTASSLIVIAPTVLLNADYSRAMEWEADTYALEGMRAHQLPLSAFASMLGKLMDSHTSQANEDERPACEDCLEPGTKDDWSSYLSSHPGTRERMERFIQAEP